MLLSKNQFNQKLEEKKLILSIIGMSNTGKTLWANKLKEIGFTNFCCDDLIEEKLEPELEKNGYKGIEDIVKWLGYPYQELFAKNEETYLNFEIETMQRIADRLNKPNKTNTIIDTTGSVIYSGSKIQKNLAALSFIIYIKIPEKMIHQMVENYFKRPKPVLWMNNFNKNEKENNEESLKRCYPELLASRDKLYTSYADKIIPYESLRKDMSGPEFLEAILNQL